MWNTYLKLPTIVRARRERVSLSRRIRTVPRPLRRGLWYRCGQCIQSCAIRASGRKTLTAIGNSSSRSCRNTARAGGGLCLWLASVAVPPKIGVVQLRWGWAVFPSCCFLFEKKHKIFERKHKISEMNKSNMEPHRETGLNWMVHCCSNAVIEVFVGRQIDDNNT